MGVGCSSTLNITAGGSAGGYVVYDGTGSTLDAQNAAATDIDVIVEDNDISGWGRTRDGTWGADMDSGIRAIRSNEELTRVTIQRNRIHDPRYEDNLSTAGLPNKDSDAYGNRVEMTWDDGLQIEGGAGIAGPITQTVN